MMPFFFLDFLKREYFMTLIETKKKKKRGVDFVNHLNKSDEKVEY